ncbi:hypothetical protein D3C81_1733830 [compost metagenome]
MLSTLIQRIDFLAVMACLREYLDQPASGEILIDVKVRQSGNPHPGDGHTSNGLAIVGLQVALDDSINDAATLMHGPHWTRAPKVEAQTIMLGEVFEGVGDSVLFQILR